MLYESSIEVVRKNSFRCKKVFICKLITIILNVKFYYMTFVCYYCTVEEIYYVFLSNIIILILIL